MSGGPSIIRASFLMLLVSFTLLTFKAIADDLPIHPDEVQTAAPESIFSVPPETNLKTIFPTPFEPTINPRCNSFTVLSTTDPTNVDQGKLSVWGLAGFRGFIYGAQVAPNGVEFNPLFSLDFDFNFWVWREQRVYEFTDARFWGQKAATGITNQSQGAFDFSKREFDLDLGLAWNYHSNFEARVFAYSFNNLNRGTSLVGPNGFKDGLGLENRWYVGPGYADLGTTDFDVSRATFVSIGFYPTKEMVDADGNSFKPGPFARAYFTLDLFDPNYYLYVDAQVIARQSFTPKIVLFDEGMAARPFDRASQVEFRLGTEGTFDFQLHEIEMNFYFAVRFVF